MGHMLKLPVPKFRSYLYACVKKRRRKTGHRETVAPLYILRDISVTVKATTFKHCIASNEYLGHIWAKFDGHS